MTEPFSGDAIACITYALEHGASPDEMRELLSSARAVIERFEDARRQAPNSPEPSAYLKLWDQNGPRCRVDLTAECEPWLEVLHPIVTPLYARFPARSDEIERLQKRLRVARNIIVDAQNFIHPTMVWRDVEAMQRAIDKFLDERLADDHLSKRLCK